MENSFLRFCETVQRIAETRSSKEKAEVFAGYLNRLERERDVELAVRFIAEGAFPSVSGRRTSVGHRTISVAASDFCGIDYERVFRPSRDALGSTSEAIEKLMDNLPAARSRREPRMVLLEEVEYEYVRLERARKRVVKEALLHEVWTQLSPLEIKFFLRILGQGSLRVGFESRSIVNAVAAAFGCDRESVRFANMITGDTGQTAVLAMSNRLDQARFRMFHPLSFMLASPVVDPSQLRLSDYVAEEKFDGMRCQLHIGRERTALFSRDLNEVTYAFPEITEYFSGKDVKDAVLDGEICVYRDDTIQPFQSLQKRIGLKKPSGKILSEYPVIFIAYDVLYIESKPVFDRPLIDRRGLLEAYCSRYGIGITSQFRPSDVQELEERFRQAVEHGNEGLMLKKAGSVYEYGHRGKSWLKMKRPGGTLDTVIMYATAGSGKRGGVYSDFTLGINVKDDERYEVEFIPIGKAYGGYTNEELAWMNRKIRDMVVDRFGPTLALKPDIVVEIEFDSILVNRRTKAGFTLRLPRFKAIRHDLGPDDTDTLKDVETLYRQSSTLKSPGKRVNPAFHMAKR